MPNLTILRTYAQKRDPSSLPSSVLFSHSEHFLTIFDAYPKAIFHFLVLPRVAAFSGADSVAGLSSGKGKGKGSPSSGKASPSSPGKDSPSTIKASLNKPLTVFDLANLRTLLKHPRAKEVLDGFRKEAAEIRAKVEEEMMGRYGFKWDVWTGFHAVPSMEHIHLHVISSDLCSPTLKNKKHYNSFHPKEGFFLHLDDVLDLFEGESTSNVKLPLSPSQYEAILKRPLACWRCHSEMKNMPTLKEHLQLEWDKERERERSKVKSRRGPAAAAVEKRKRSDIEGEDFERDGASDASGGAKHSRREE